jgi:hypothetical protein
MPQVIYSTGSTQFSPSSTRSSICGRIQPFTLLELIKKQYNVLCGAKVLLQGLQLADKS